MLRILLILLVATLGCAGGEISSLPTGTDRADRTPSAESLVGVAGETAVSRTPDGQHPRRIIYTADIDVIVEEFDAIPGKVAELAEQFGGFVASSNVYGEPGSPRHGSWTIRVPVEHYSDLLSKAGELGELRSLSSNSKDVSEEYYDIEARIRNKQKTEARIVTLLEEATGNLEQVLEVEQKLDRVREEIERMQGRLRVLTDQTALATVTVMVEQIPGYQPEEKPTYGTRVRRTFRVSLHSLLTTAANLSIAVVALSPWLGALLVLTLIAAPIVLIVRRIRRSQPPQRPEM